jgi:hypothetical protein
VRDRRDTSNTNPAINSDGRAKAVVAYFPAIPQKVRLQLQEIIARAIERALNQRVAQLEISCSGGAPES